MTSLPTSLLGCPTELLLLILRWLPPPDLRALCLCCRDLCAIVEPHLYSEIRLEWPEYGEWVPIVPLLRRLASRPVAVHSLALIGDTFGGMYACGITDVGTIYVEVEDRAWMVECIRAMGVPYADFWVQDLELGTLDALVALLLWHVPDLRYLRIERNFAISPYIVNRLLDSAFGKEAGSSVAGKAAPSFQRLKSVYFDVYEEYLSVDRCLLPNTNVCLLFCYPPALESLAIAMDEFESPLGAPFPWPGASRPALPALSSLRLQLVREGHLGDILSATPVLKKLHFQWIYCQEVYPREQGPPFKGSVADLDIMTASLRRVRDTLAELTISAEALLRHSTLEGPAIVTTKGSLGVGGLTALRSLELPALFILGSRSPPTGGTLGAALPAALESLTLTDDLWWHVPYMKASETLLRTLSSWLRGWRSGTPHLRRFRLHLKEMGDEQWPPAAREELRQLGVDAGLKVEVVNGKMLAG